MGAICSLQQEELDSSNAALLDCIKEDGSGSAIKESGPVRLVDILDASLDVFRTEEAWTVDHRGQFRGSGGEVVAPDASILHCSGLRDDGLSLVQSEFGILMHALARSMKERPHRTHGKVFKRVVLNDDCLVALDAWRSRWSRRAHRSIIIRVARC